MTVTPIVTFCMTLITLGVTRGHAPSIFTVTQPLTPPPTGEETCHARLSYLESVAPEEPE